MKSEKLRSKRSSPSIDSATSEPHEVSIPLVDRYSGRTGKEIATLLLRRKRKEKRRKSFNVKLSRGINGNVAVRIESGGGPESRRKDTREAPCQSYLPATPTKMEIREEKFSEWFSVFVCRLPGWSMTIHIYVRAIRIPPLKSPRENRRETPEIRWKVRYFGELQSFPARVRTSYASVFVTREGPTDNSIPFESQGEEKRFVWLRLRKGTRTMMTDTTVSIWRNFPFA
ncbi:hypothetical protein ALC57_02334 [Trachymyrmex cornetzi]|uniref:Uncharacterized protein n=1 Tax=Trachymyrmex cornetzi TaxID=471704 RepID=A0A195EJ43_9HYME|nr:hypothetical protein ALC57_02334 [Trachymyrmex cornetzi]